METQNKSTSVYKNLIIGGLGIWIWWLLKRKPKACPICLKPEPTKCPDCIQNPCPKCIDKTCPDCIQNACPECEECEIQAQQVCPSCSTIKNLTTIGNREFISRYQSFGQTFIDGNGFEFFMPNDQAGKIYFIGPENFAGYENNNVLAFKNTQSYANRYRIIEDVVIDRLKNYPNGIGQIDTFKALYPTLYPL